MAVPAFVAAIGQGVGTFVCVPANDVWVTPGGSGALSLWYFAGQCPAGGSISCLSTVLPNGLTIAQQLANTSTAARDGSTCYQAGAYASAGGGGSSSSSGAVTGEVTLKPFEYSADQQREIYQSMTVVFGVTLGACAAIWGLRRLYRLLSGYSGASGE